MIVTTHEKPAAWRRVYSYDFSLADEFRGETPPTIVSATASVSAPTGLTVGSTSIGDSASGVVKSVVQITVSGGTPVTTYTVTVTATLSDGTVLTLGGRYRVT